jgi:hypothetical protein
MKTLTSLVLVLLLSGSAIADEIDFSFNSDAFRFIYAHDFASNDLRSDFGLLTTDDEGWIATTSLYLTGAASEGNNPLEAGIGGRTGWVEGDLSKQSGLPLAVGGFLKYTIPRFNRVSLRGEAWFAPDILSFGDLERYQDYSVRIGYNVLKQADIYLGYRYVKGHFSKAPSAEFDDKAHLGISIRF